MSGKAEAILEQAKELDLDELRVLTRKLNERIEEEHDREGERVAAERLAQVERGEVEMIPWEEFQRRVDELRK